MNANPKEVTTKTRAQEWLPTSQVPVHPYEKLRLIDVSERLEKKNGLSYLSWAYAVDQLLQAEPTANWDYPPAQMYGETMMVYCAVTAFGKTMQAHLPVMNHMNKPIPNPDAFQVNTAMQRCLVKAIALHGIGLAIYAGEDLGWDSDAKGDVQHVDPKVVNDLVLEFRQAMALDAPEEDTAQAVFAVHSRIANNEDLYIAVGDALQPKERAAIKACVALHKRTFAQAPVSARGR